MATDADAAYVDWGSPGQRAIAAAHPDALDALHDEFGAGSMGPKVEAAAAFARGGRRAVIGSLVDIPAMLAGAAGTLVSPDIDGIAYRDG
jgi:carbamate kinase